MSCVIASRVAVPTVPVAARQLASTRSGFAGAVPRTIRRSFVSHHARTTKRARHQTLIRAGWNDFEWGSATIVSNDLAAKEGGLHVVIVRVAEEVTKGYVKPGQFVQMRIGDEGKPAFLAIASPPGADDTNLQLLIKSVDGTAGDICAMKPGDTLGVSPAMGNGFDLGKAPASETPNTLLFATGSGISPIRSLIQSGALGDRDVTLFYGTASEKTTAFADEFKAWEAKGIKVVHVMSQGTYCAFPKSRRLFAHTRLTLSLIPLVGGPPTYVQEALRLALENVDAAKTCAVLCGQKEMTEAVIEVLTGHGVAKEKCIMNF
jgi:ferredoxin-NADP reductase|tara:strand:+ start:5783 stop:6739 length:957 start_codon:yes stop_codon:yes gene_type:complete